MKTTPAKLDEFNHAEDPARRLPERLGWTCVPREVLAAERTGGREVLLKGWLWRAMLRLNESPAPRLRAAVAVGKSRRCRIVEIESDLLAVERDIAPWQD